MLRRLLHALRTRPVELVTWWVVCLTQPRFLVTAVALLRAPDGRILLLENRFWAGNPWGCPSGYMRRGESPEDAAARECREECGVEASDLRVARVHAESPYRLEMWCTGTVPITEAPTDLQSREILSAALLPPEEALRRMRSGQAAVVRELLKADGQ